MSFNDTIIRRDEISLVTKRNLLERLSSSGSYAAKNFTKHKILSTQDYEDFISARKIRTTTFNQLDIESLDDIKEVIDYFHEKQLAAEEVLTEKINSYNSESDNKKLLVSGKLKELRQKLNTLQGKTSSVRFLIKEDFLNLFNLDTQRSKRTTLGVNTEAEVLTLPVISNKTVSVAKIFISKESNCIPGSYLQGGNKYIYSIIDDNEDTVFEAFKEGEGPLLLDITLTFRAEEIINQLSIGQLNTRGTSSIEIEDVIYSDVNNRSYSLRRLINLDKQSLSILSTANKQDLHIVHIPVRAVQAKVTLKVKEFSKLNGQDVFLLGLKTIKFGSSKYASSGEICSTSFDTPEGFFQASYTEATFPKQQLVFSSKMSISTNNGGEYRDVKSGSTLITNPNPKELTYKYHLVRDDNNINKVNAILDDNYFVDVATKSSLIDKAISPSSFELPFKKTLRGSLTVIQNKVLSRSDDLSRRVIIGKVRNDGLNEFVLQTNLNNYPIEDISVYINRQLATYKPNTPEISVHGEWTMGVDGKSIQVFINKTQPILEVSLLLKPSLPVIVKKREGYYIKIDENFDYDKNTLKLTCVTGLSEEVNEIIPVEKEKVFLSHEYLDQNHTLIEEYDSSGWKTDDASTVNYVDGIVTIPAGGITKERRISYKHYITKTLSAEQYEIWVKDDKVKGLFIYPEHISFEEKVDVLNAEPKENYYLFDGTYSKTRSLNSNEKCFPLSSPNVIKGTLHVSKNLFDDEDFKEIEYIDGFTEFLHLKKMQKDYIPAIQFDANDQVQFSLQETPYNQGSFSDPIAVYNANGELLTAATVAVTGSIATLTLTEAPSTSAGLYLSYYYQGEVATTPTFSVDYLNGILYTSDAPQETAQVSYRIGRIGLEYYIYNRVKNFETNYNDLSISVRTEEFYAINNNIKFLAFKNKEQMSLEGIEGYFSPIVYSLEVGLN